MSSIFLMQLTHEVDMAQEKLDMSLKNRWYEPQVKCTWSICINFL